MSRYKVGDKVSGPVFWMTVDEVKAGGAVHGGFAGSVLHPTGYRCSFGSSGHDAGTFREDELNPLETTQTESANE